jgi:AraC-like DNA-binding protein
MDIQQVFGIIYGVLILSVFYLNYQGIRHYTLDQEYSGADTPTIQFDNQVRTVTPATSIEPGVHKDIKLTPEEEQIETDILTVLDDEQLYLEPKLSLDEIAGRVGQNKHVVSKVINSKADRSFYDLVNGYRCEHLKKLLDDPKNDKFTILALGLESGFNSKASLNRIFLKYCNLTPKQYRTKRSQSIA